MIALFSDTHSHQGHELEGEALTAAREATTVIHAGDFTSIAALEAFIDETGELFAVHGNADSSAVRDRVPAERVVDVDGARIAVTHRSHSGETGLVMFGKAHDADLVVTGHTHRPAVIETDDIVVCNPGSHADPRGNRPGFARLERAETRLEGELVEPDGQRIETFDVAISDRS